MTIRYAIFLVLISGVNYYNVTMLADRNLKLQNEISDIRIRSSLFENNFKICRRMIK